MPNFKHLRYDCDKIAQTILHIIKWSIKLENLEFIKNEMLVHIPMCTHANPQKILIINANEALIDELKKYSNLKEIISINVNDSNKTLDTIETKNFDVAIIADDSFVSNREFWISLTKLLDSKGLVSSPMSNLIFQEEEAKAQLKTIGAIYQIVMPYRYEGKDNLESEYVVLASRFYHPTANINLQRADLTDGFKYYNSDIAISTFQMPTFINQKYLGIIKR